MIEITTADLLLAAIQSVLEVAADVGLGEPARALRERLTHAREKALRAGFDRAYQAAVNGLGESAGELQHTLNHVPFQQAVATALLDPSAGLDLSALAAEWQEKLPAHAPALRKFFNLLRDALMRDSEWGELLERFGSLRDQDALAEKSDLRSVVRSVTIDLTGGSVAAVDHSTAVGEGGVNVQNSPGSHVNIGDTHIYNPPPPDPGEAVMRIYLEKLVAEFAALPLGIINEAFTSQNTLSIDNVYINLDVIGIEQQHFNEKDFTLISKQFMHKERYPRIPLLDVIRGNSTLRLVLLGAAGSGKTTFMNNLTWMLAQVCLHKKMLLNLPTNLRGKIPVHFVLRNVASLFPVNKDRNDAEILWKALKQDLKSRNCAKAFKFLCDEIKAGHSVLLFDGFDEVPDANNKRAHLMEAICKFLNELPPDQLVILTARSYAYTEPKWQLPGAQVFNLAHFTSEQIKNFIEIWYHAVAPVIHLSRDEAQNRAVKLFEDLAVRRHLSDLASRPLLLTLIASIHATSGVLPKDQAELYERALTLLLVSWQKKLVPQLVKDEGLDQLDINSVRAVLAEIAFQTHRRQRKGPETEGPADIPFNDLVGAFSRCLPRRVHPVALAEYLEQRIGLLVEREPGKYCFVHRSFQEYLAACHLQATSQIRSSDLRKLVEEDAVWWHEVILLAIGKVRQDGLNKAVDLVTSALMPASNEEVVTPSSVQWRGAILATQAFTDLGLKDEVADDLEMPYLLPRARRWLVQLLKQNALSARERVNAGDLLAEIGDPRFTPTHAYLPDDNLLGFCKVVAGPFLMGSRPGHDPYAADNEQPQHTLHLEDFFIQAYPVTVAQYSTFVSQSGYKPKDTNCLLGFPNHPVVRVTWHDAIAYCDWLEERLLDSGPAELSDRLTRGGWRVALPSEAEWEKAARGVDGLIYPWGNEANPNNSNIEETGINRRSAVGCFSGGQSPYGIHEMSGSILEWTRSLWGRGEFQKPDFVYPYSGDIMERENLKAPNDYMRVIRGGSFNISSRFARCTSRSRSLPGLEDGDLGFRVVISSLAEPSLVQFNISVDA